MDNRTKAAHLLRNGTSVEVVAELLAERNAAFESGRKAGIAEVSADAAEWVERSRSGREEAAIMAAVERGCRAGAAEAIATLTPSLKGCPAKWRESVESITQRAVGNIRLALGAAKETKP